jgi:phosphoribosylformimino-5-aminoimidazole carboxamide ribotide isomerase
MQIIPVLDIMAGQVVRAHRGQRDRYRPITSALCATSDPESIIAALLARFPFPAIYVADLDAITGRGANADLIANLSRRFPGIHWWLDAGFATADDYRPYRPLAAVVPVIGSESQRGIGSYLSLVRELPAAILSLDFSGDTFLGPPELATDASLWPERVIVMTLDRIGGGLGPDLVRLGALARAHPAIRFHAAGGVRDGRDLDAVAATGAAGVLVASLLHDRAADVPALGARFTR